MKILVLILGSTTLVAGGTAITSQQLFDGGNRGNDMEIFPVGEEWQRDGSAWNTQSALDVADFNQDGFDDLLMTTTEGSWYLSVYLSQNGLGFNEAWRVQLSSIGGSPNPGQWVAADVNGDGFPDLVKGENNTGIMVYINQLGPSYACGTDLNKDGQTSVHDILFVLAGWGPCD
jgi:hypothetical protein